LNLSVHDVSEIVHSVAEIITATGLISGGLWTAWTFQKLQRVRASELEINQGRSNLQNSRLQREELTARLLGQQPQLAIGLSISEEVSPLEDYQSVLCITATLKNEGQQNLDVDFYPSSLIVATIAANTTQEDGTPTFEDVHRFSPGYFSLEEDALQVWPSRILRAGQMRRIAIGVLPVPKPEAYFIQFQVAYKRTPFDGEKKLDAGQLTTINAVEQTLYVASGGRSIPTATATLGIKG
jgi:hypothetical protein